MICGASIGSAVGAAYLCGNDPAEVERLLDGSARTLFKPRLPIKGFLTSAPLGRYLREAYEGKRIEELPLPFGIVAADLPTHREVVFRRGILWRAVLASIARSRAVFRAQRMGAAGARRRRRQRHFGCRPSVACDMGAATVIAVRLLSLPETAEMEIALRPWSRAGRRLHLGARSPAVVRDHAGTHVAWWRRGRGDGDDHTRVRGDSGPGSCATSQAAAATSTRARPPSRRRCHALAACFPGCERERARANAPATLGCGRPEYRHRRGDRPRFEAPARPVQT